MKLFVLFYVIQKEYVLQISGKKTYNYYICIMIQLTNVTGRDIKGKAVLAAFTLHCVSISKT